MILYKGKIYDTTETKRLLSTLQADANDALLHKSVDKDKLISAVDMISKRISKGEYDEIINGLDIDGIDEYKNRAAEILTRENIELNLKAQLPAMHDLPKITAYTAPVGVLFHIAAGNVDVLPAYSVLTGLLCGNVNVLKLPSQDNGITVKILSELISLLPELSDFIYVFDTPSSDVISMVKMAEAADKIIVWGGDEAVSAVRRLAPPQIPVAAWGHKISFAYIGADYEKYETELSELAEHVIKTSQLLCSSCQRIYVNSDNPDDADKFCRYFLPILQSARDKFPLKDIGAAAEATIYEYSRKIENSIYGVQSKNERVYAGKGCRLISKDDKTLEISGFFGQLTVSAVPLCELFDILREKKGYLQTACVIADKETGREAERIAVAAGVTRLTKPKDMSEAFIGEAHDGRSELSEYIRIINKEV